MNYAAKLRYSLYYPKSGPKIKYYTFSIPIEKNKRISSQPITFFSSLSIKGVFDLKITKNKEDINKDIPTIPHSSIDYKFLLF